MPIAAAIATFVMILAAAYLLWMFQRLVFGDLSEFLRGLGHHLTDVRPVEALTLVPLGTLVVIFGLFPGLVLDLVQGTVRQSPRTRSPAPSRSTSPVWRSGGRRADDDDLPTDVLAISRRSSPRSLLAAAILSSTSSSPAAACRRSSTAFIGLAIVGALVALPATVGHPAGEGVRRRLQRRRPDDVPRPAVRRHRRAHDRCSRPTTSRSATCPWRSSRRSSCSRCPARCSSRARRDLLVLFLGLELMVLPGYLLAGYHKRDGYSTEGAIKYFLLGSFSSAIFLFGLAFIWGLTGTTRIDGVADQLTEIAAGRRRCRRPRDGARVPDDRRGVQDRRRAVPLLDAGRLPGLADAGDRLPVGRARRSAPSR